MNAGTLGFPNNLSAQDRFNIIRPPIICNARYQQLLSNNHYIIVFDVETRLVLPYIARPGDIVCVSNNSNIFTHFVARNGHRINQSNEDLILDVPERMVMLKYINRTIGWIVN